MGKDSTCTALFKLWRVIFSELWIVKYRRLMVLTTKLKFLKVQNDRSFHYYAFDAINTFLSCLVSSLYEHH